GEKRSRRVADGGYHAQRLRPGGEKRVGEGHENHRYLFAQGHWPGPRQGCGGVQIGRSSPILPSACSGAGVHPMIKPADIPMGSSDFVEKLPLERYVAPERPSLIGLTRAQLADALNALGVPEAQHKMRVQQLWHWMYFRGVTSFDEMTSVSKDLRLALAGRYTLARPEIVAEQVSVDGTRKWLLRLPGEVQGERPHEVECVYIPDTERGTLCVSSQVGCTLNCTFCHTGTQRLVRNLTA